MRIKFINCIRVFTKGLEITPLRFHQMRTQEEVTAYEPGNGFHPTMLALDVGLARLQHYEKKILLLIGGPDCGILL